MRRHAPITQRRNEAQQKKIQQPDRSLERRKTSMYEENIIFLFETEPVWEIRITITG